MFHNVHFLRHSGAGYVQRKLAAAAALTHIITMDVPNKSVFRLQEKSGVLDTDTEYPITPSQQTESLFGGGKKFLDTVTWEYVSDLPSHLRSYFPTAGDSSAVCLHVRKVSQPDNSYELNVYRVLEGGTQQIRCVAEYSPSATVKNNKVGSKRVVAVSMFARAGDSPNAPPEALEEEEEEAAAEEAKPQSPGDSSSPTNSRTRSRTMSVGRARLISSNMRIPRDFSGVWTRTKTVNFEAFIGKYFSLFFVVFVCVFL